MQPAIQTGDVANRAELVEGKGHSADFDDLEPQLKVPVQKSISSMACKSDPFASGRPP
jgi:hypothetical protein